MFYRRLVGYDILRPAKKAKTSLTVRVHDTVEVDGKAMTVHKDLCDNDTQFIDVFVRKSVWPN